MASEEGEEGEEGVAGRLRDLSDAEKAELEGFVRQQEGERDKGIASHQATVAGYLDQLLPVVRTPYVRGRDQFYRLRHTAVAKVGSETMLAVVRGPERVYAAQGGRVITTQVTPGFTNL
ncbi:unnamed protein product [Phytomonas sp. Hart1]|nr:unnamed protein product [Phytomonas sp. Hart1]|eukprot:CCW70739.1 unnamed protein product [Phytomonas sp. isolate Hart1]